MKTAVRLLSFLRPVLLEVFWAVCAGAGTAAAGIGLLGVSAYLIASAALHPSVGALQVAIVGVRFFGLARGILRYIERLVSHSVNFRLLARIRVWFYRSIEPLAPARLEPFRGGDLLARAVGDINTLENFYVRCVSPPLVALFVTLGVGWFAGQIYAVSGWILGCGLALAGSAAPLLTYILARRAGRAVAEQRARLSSSLLAAIQGWSELAVFGQDGATLKTLQSENHALETAGWKLAQAGALGQALSGLLAQWTLWALLVCGIPAVRLGLLDGVSLAVLALISLASFEAVQPLTQAAQQMEGALASAQRLFELADTPPAVLSPISAPPLPDLAGLTLRSLSFRYRIDAPLVLDDIHLDLPVGKRIALVGPSGSGKSTLASLLLRFWDCPPQSIFLGEKDIREFEPSDVRKRIGLVSQRAFLFSGSLRRNLLLAKPNALDEEIEQALDSAGLASLLQRLPEGLDTWLGSQGEQLSGGERQRLALARAWLQSPSYWVLDEPTAGLDALSARAWMDTLRQSNEKRGLLLITHHLLGLEWLDEIAVLQDGRITERGTHAVLVAQGGWFAQARELQRRAMDADDEEDSRRDHMNGG